LPQAKNLGSDDLHQIETVALGITNVIKACCEHCHSGAGKKNLIIEVSETISLSNTPMIDSSKATKTAKSPNATTVNHTERTIHARNQSENRPKNHIDQTPKN
jgi:hypothetical protein